MQHINWLALAHSLVVGLLPWLILPIAQYWATAEFTRTPLLTLFQGVFLVMGGGMVIKVLKTGFQSYNLSKNI